MESEQPAAPNLREMPPDPSRRPRDAAASMVAQRAEVLRHAVAEAATPEALARARVALAEWLVVHGERLEAEATWRAAVEADPQAPVVRAASAGLVARLGGKPAARPTLRKAATPSSLPTLAKPTSKATTRGRKNTSATGKRAAKLPLPSATEWASPKAALDAGKPQLAARLAVGLFLRDHKSEHLAAIIPALEASGQARIAAELRSLLKGDPGAVQALAMPRPRAGETPGPVPGALQESSSGGSSSRALSAPATPAQHWRAAERLLATYRQGEKAAPASELVRQMGTHLSACLVGHPGADAAVRFLEMLVAQGWPLPAREILQRALSAEAQSSRRLELAVRLVRLWETAGDASQALRVADDALAMAWGEEAPPLRAARARILRAQDDREKLAQARLEDARMLAGAARLEALEEAALQLDLAGDRAQALGTRIEALEGFPAALDLFERVASDLSEQGDWARLATLGQACFDEVTSTAGRARLLRALAPGGRAAAHPRLAPLTNALVASLAREPGQNDTAALTASAVAAQGDLARAAALLGWRAARATDVGAKRSLTWELAEMRRLKLNQGMDAERLYRSLTTPGGGATKVELAEHDEALHHLREAAAPTPAAKAAALADLAEIRLLQGDTAAALALAEQALDRDAACLTAVRVLEGVFARRQDAAEMARRLSLRALAVPPAGASRLWFGVAWAREQTRDLKGAREALGTAIEGDPSFREAWTAARRLAGEQGEWREASRLIERELATLRDANERLPLLLEWADVLRTRLGDTERAHACLAEATNLALGDRLALDRVVDACLAAGAWERAHDAVHRFVAEGGKLADLGDRYLRIGQVAESSGDAERALSFYSQAYGHAPRARVVLEKLAQLCFERKDWDSALRANNELLEHHRNELPRPTVAATLMRVAWTEMHLGQRWAALGRVREVLGGPLHGENAAREVADNWAAATFEPRLLRLLEPSRRKRIDGLLSEALRLTEPPTAGDPTRAKALLAIGALAFVDRRVREGVRALDTLAEDLTFDLDARVRFLVAAGDLLLADLVRVGSDEAARRQTAALARYARARALAPHHVLLADPRRG